MANTLPIPKILQSNKGGHKIINLVRNQKSFLAMAKQKPLSTKPKYTSDFLRKIQIKLLGYYIRIRKFQKYF